MARAPIKSLPSQAELRAALDYDLKTGLLAWKERAGPRAAGAPAGTINARGYLVVGLGGQYFTAHRIIWKMMTGRDPGECVDHRDGVRLNNRWGNLRNATNGQNIQNAKLRCDNKSGVKGVTWDAWHSKWRAQITVHGKQIRIGRFASVIEASRAIEIARANMHGEFARAA